MELLTYETYRSQPTVNMDEDMVRVTLTGNRREIRRLMYLIEYDHDLFFFGEKKKEITQFAVK